MAGPWTGGCACGAIRYETPAEPLFQNHCQCLDCQKRSGAGHGSWLTFPRRAEMRITGEANTWRVAADNRNEKVHAFCPTCGTPVYLRFAAAPDMIAVSAAPRAGAERAGPLPLGYGGGARTWGAGAGYIGF